MDENSGIDQSGFGRNDPRREKFYNKITKCLGGEAAQKYLAMAVRSCPQIT
jgi:hypothetical protein